MQVGWHINSSEIPKSMVDEFLATQRDQSFFQSHSFIELYKKDKFQTLNLIGVSKNKVVAYCNVLILKESYGILSSLTSRAIIWGGPLALLDVYFEEALIKLKAELEKIAIYLQIRNIFPISQVRREILSSQGILYQEHFTVINQVTQNLFASYQSKARNKIRKSIKNELTFQLITQHEQIEKAGILIIQNYKEMKLPCPSINFFKQTSSFDDIKVFGVFHNSVLIGVRFCISWNDYLYDWYAGSNKKYNYLSPNDFVVHKILEWGFENGFNTFDFGGAGNSLSEYGVRDFKLKFGGQLTEFGRNEIVFQPFKFKLGKLGFQLLKKFRK
jgi:serine/alanine adding enzyme